MIKLISGEEAKLAWANGKQIELKPKIAKYWLTEIEDMPISVFDSDCYEFRLKPRTISLNGIEVPVCGENYQAGTYMFVLNSLEVDEYSKVILDANDEVPAYWWRTEEEVKQVVAALRSVFKA